MIALAAKTCGTPLTISFDEKDDRSLALSASGCQLRKESLSSFLSTLQSFERIRTCGADLPMELYQAAAKIDKYIATAPPVKEGRVELIHYIKEQSITFEYHRYGSITEIPPIE